jgi:nitroreductase
MVVAVVSGAAPHPKIPEWEQTLSSAAVCMNMLLAATALGIGCQWQTDWPAYDAEIGKVMVAHEKIAGFIYLGTARPCERPRRSMPLLTRWGQ